MFLLLKNTTKRSLLLPWRRLHLLPSSFRKRVGNPFPCGLTNKDKLDARYFEGLEAIYCFGLCFSVNKIGDPNYIVSCQENVCMMRSTSADLTLGAREYQIFLKIEANWHYPLYFVQEVIRANVQTRRAKLLQVALNPSIAHGKVRDEPEFEGNAAKKRAERRKLSKFKTRVGEKLTKDKKSKKHLENK
jgi:hypothetical protein